MKLRKLLRQIDVFEQISIYDTRNCMLLYDKAYKYNISLESELTNILDFKVRYIKAKHDGRALDAFLEIGV